MNKTDTFDFLPVTYDSLDDLNRKLEFYLGNEKARKEISLNFKNEIHEKHTFLQRLEELIKTVRNI